MNPDSRPPLRGTIAAMTRDHVIGLDGKIPWHYPEDLQRFKKRTLHSAIIMGRRTWESIHCRSLPQRRNIVISRNRVDNVEHYGSLTLALDACAGCDTWIIGGGQIYQEGLPWTTLLDITYVPDVIRSEDAIRFPSIDSNEWEAVETVLVANTNLQNIIYRRR
ncbi:MAG: dihydrofolate reductase [Gammaproteobacteria bacterium]|nr:dihydrofolate reductase [Gammaproteobacteria bacterium]